MNHKRMARGGFDRATPHRQRGISLVLMAVSLVVLFGFGAMALDGANLYVARNELQNAADAGALAGARELYVADGSMVNEGANQIARETAQANNSQGTQVEVASVRRGHWSFIEQQFTPNPSLEPVDLFDATTEELDLNTNFINAIEVVTERRQTPVQAFFGFVLGFTDYTVASRAVAYIGFAGKLNPEDIDQPLAMCSDAVMDGGTFSCSVGRMIDANAETGGWTNLQHDSDGAASAAEIRELMCGDGNPDELFFGEDLTTTKGQVHGPAFNAMYDCWVEETEQERLWSMTLPVVDCSDGIQPSSPLIGAVNLNIVWMVDKDNNIDADAPRRMERPAESSDGPPPPDWTSDDPDGQFRWDDFVSDFMLEQPDGSPADYRQKSIYYLPSCEAHEPKGQTGGENFGVLAQIPVLVD